MEYIIDFFVMLGDIISSIVDFVIDFFTGLIDFFTSIPEYVETIEQYMDLLPTPLIAIAALALAAQLIFIIIGRRGV